MHNFGMVLIWTAIQVTVIFSVIALVLRFAGKSEPLWRGKIILAGLGSALLVSACSLSPWPCWSDYLSSAEAPVAQSEHSSSQPPKNASLVADSPGFEQPAAPSGEKRNGELESPWSAGWTAFLEQVKRPRPMLPSATIENEQAKPAFTIFSGIAILVLAGVGFGLMRLVAGIWLLGREVSRSQVLHDERVNSVIQQIINSSAGTPAIEVRVAGKLQSAATTGIRRPVILLPACWESWSDEELHAVLAHELNHIQRKDCLTALFAELTRVLHFYHPLMHWLANRLRLEQELAADAQAARSLGGQKRYLCILAEMALNETSRAPAWPARAFLPSHRTFMRRIEMLKNNHLSEHRVSRGSRFAVIAVLALSTIFALGLRNGAGKVTAQDDTTAEPGVSEIAQAENAAIPHAKSIPFPLTYAPDDAIAIFAVRPSELLAKPALKSLAELILKNERTAKPMGIPLEQIEQVVFSFGTRDTDRHEPELIAAMIRISGKLDLETLKAEITPNSETGFYGGQLYLREAGRHDPAFWLADEHTLIYSQTETGLKQAIDARNLSVNREKRIPVWGSVANQTAAGYANIGQLRRMFNGEDRFGGEGYGRPMQPGQQFQKSMGLNPMFGPLWNDVETITGGAVFGQDIDAKLTATSKDENGAGKVEETLKAMLVLGRNMINQNQQMIGQLPQQEQKMVGALLTLSQEVFKTLKVEKAQAQVIVEAKLPENTARLITTSLVPAVLAGQQSANQAISKNNLKQIGLAMHNYADVHKKFPTPVVMGPDGKTPHSWRVEILPFIDQIELYNQYHMNEPWDSESNKKLVEKIPPIYRHPLDKPDSTNASYFALVGSHTLMGDNKKGTWFGDITDGTSNTLMIVEAKREIPWTKPDDIPYADDRSKPVPALGGWFNEGFIAALGDGSVRMFSGKLSKATLQKLIERDDGNPISGDELDGTPGGPNSDSPLSPRGDSGGESGGSAEAYDVDGSETGSAPRRGFGTDRRIKSPE